MNFTKIPLLVIGNPTRNGAEPLRSAADTGLKGLITPVARLLAADQRVYVAMALPCGHQESPVLYVY